MHCPLQIVRMYEPHNHEGREHGKLNGFSTRKQGTQAICLPVGCVDVSQEISGLEGRKCSRRHPQPVVAVDPTIAVSRQI